MTDPKVHFVTLEMSSLDEYSQRELTAYRNIGTLREFRRLQHEEMSRKERKRRFIRTLHTLLAGALLSFILACFSLICVIFA